MSKQMPLSVGLSVCPIQKMLIVVMYNCELSCTRLCNIEHIDIVVRIQHVDGSSFSRRLLAITRRQRHILLRGMSVRGERGVRGRVVLRVVLDARRRHHVRLS